MVEIRFERCLRPGYAARTRLNAAAADLTLAVAVDFRTLGEELTRKEALCAGKLYQSVHVAHGPVDPFRVAEQLAPHKFDTLNFAGNGIYTMAKYGWTQFDCDQYALELLSAVLAQRPLKEVRSGGQTGFDEAGAKAAALLGVPTVVVAPVGWTFRDVHGVDHHGETAFVARFRQ